MLARVCQYADRQQFEQHGFRAATRGDRRCFQYSAIVELDKEIESLLFETRVRREVVSDTVTVLLERAAARRQASLNVPQGEPIDPRPLSNGRVQ